MSNVSKLLLVLKNLTNILQVARCVRLSLLPRPLATQARHLRTPRPGGGACQRVEMHCRRRRLHQKRPCLHPTGYRRILWDRCSRGPTVRILIKVRRKIFRFVLWYCFINKLDFKKEIEKCLVFFVFVLVYSVFLVVFIVVCFVFEVFWKKKQNFTFLFIAITCLLLISFLICKNIFVATFCVEYDWPIRFLTQFFIFFTFLRTSYCSLMCSKSS